MVSRYGVVFQTTCLKRVEKFVGSSFVLMGLSVFDMGKKVSGTLLNSITKHALDYNEWVEKKMGFSHLNKSIHENVEHQ